MGEYVAQGTEQEWSSSKIGGRWPQLRQGVDESTVGSGVNRRFLYLFGPRRAPDSLGFATGARGCLV